MTSAGSPDRPSGWPWRHGRDDLAEALGLFTFMMCAGSLLTPFEHPGSPLHAAIGSGLARRSLLGACMAGVTAAIIYASWSQRAGAHINPAVTWTFFRLGKIDLQDAVLYTAAQLAGGLIAPLVLGVAIGTAFAHPQVMSGATLPKASGPLAAFGAEFAISFLLMLALLLCNNSRRREKRAGLVAAMLIGLFIVFESPISGMSLNPARSFGSAANSGEWRGLWVYFTAPPLAMLLAAEAFLLLRRQGLVESGRAGDRRRLIRDFKNGPRYPLPASSEP